MKSVYFIASEALPYIKSGGLADVVASLSKELVKSGYDVRVVLPLYQKIIDNYYPTLNRIATIPINSGWIKEPATYYETENEGVKYYFIEHRAYFERNGLYGYVDDGERFSFFQRASLDLLYVINWFPDVVHCHDWQTGMLPLMSKVNYIGDERYQKLKFVLTIHNLAFQGNFPFEVLGQCLGIDRHFYDNGSTRFDSGISFLKTGIVYSDKISTVSNSYAREILTDEFGERLNSVLNLRKDDLWGIVNGIDTDLWNPKTDKLLSYNYDKRNFVKGKSINKLDLQKELGLKEDKDVLLIGLVSRLTNQKGVYLIIDKFREIMNLKVQFVVLGSGEDSAENSFKWLESNYKGRAVYYAGYNEDLAHKIYAGSDIFLMPSLYEPCGISQLISLRYGTLPLVRETGGLIDTVKPYDEYNKEGWGFSFSGKNSNDMFNIIRYAHDVYYNNPKDFKMLIRNAFDRDVSWGSSCNLYKELYESL